MMEILLSLYRFIFCRQIFYRFNYHVERVARRGIGIQNPEGSEMTGEKAMFRLLAERGNIQTVVDVGANTGGYKKELLEAIPQLSYYGIEPHPETFKTLQKRVKGRLHHVYNVALGAKNGSIKLYDFADDADLKHTQPTSTLASTIPSVIRDFHHQKAQSFRVKQMTLDTFVQKEKLETIDLLKIDTEGNELQVLQGAKDLLKRKKVRFVQFEFNEMNAYSKTFFKDFVDLLPGYTFYRLMPHGLYPMGPYRPSTHEVFAFQNILAIPDTETALLS